MKIGHAAAALVAASGLQLASADVIVFENDNPAFEVLDGGYRYDIYYPGMFLDVTAPASEQPFTDGTPGGRIGFYYWEGETSSSGISFTVRRLGSTAVALGDPTSYMSSDGPVSAVPVRDVQPGQAVDGSLEFAAPGSDTKIGINFFGVQAWFVGYEFTVGLRFELPTGTHYGFATFSREPGVPWEADYRPIRWGYESEPDTAIVVPGTPHCLADFGQPDGVVDIFDLLAFLEAYDSPMTTFYAADLAEPFGWIDIFDLLAFTDAYTAGCP